MEEREAREAEVSEKTEVIDLDDSLHGSTISKKPDDHIEG